MNRGLLPINQGSADPSKSLRSDGSWQYSGVSKWPTAPGTVYSPPTLTVGNSSNTIVAGSGVAIPVMVPNPVVWWQIGFGVTATSTGAFIRHTLWADDGTGYPASLLMDWGQVDASSTGGKWLTINYTPNPGALYWYCGIAQGANATVRAEFNGGRAWPGMVFTYGGRIANINSDQAAIGWSNGGSMTGAPPSVWPSGSVPTGSQTLIPFFRMP